MGRAPKSTNAGSQTVTKSTNKQKTFKPIVNVNNADGSDSYDENNGYLHLNTNKKFQSAVTNEHDSSLTVEQTYQKKTQLEHILLRPDTYIGSTTLDSQEMWIFDDKTNSIIKKNITFSPGLYKIFDEILVNASDNKERDKNMSKIQINVDTKKNEISVWNDGLGIPVTIHKDENMYVPTLIFGHLLTSSNYNDNQKKITGGRNGFGAKLCNIFSNKFIVETASKKYGKHFIQQWSNNMNDANDPIVKEFNGKDFTCVTFSPDLSRFGLTHIDDDFLALFKRRAYDISGVAHGIKVYFNGELLKIKDFKAYSMLYLRGINGTDNVISNDEQSNNTAPNFDILYEKVNDRWEICVAPIDSGPQQMSFVNSIATTKGGTHVNYIYDQLINYLMPIISKKVNDKKLIKPVFIKSSIFLFVNSKIENPCFDSQTKENLVLSSKKFGSSCELSEKFLKQVSKVCTDSIVEFVNLKSKTALMKISKNSKKAAILAGIPKLDDANKAGTSLSSKCVLILTEGDSAKSLAIAGLSVIGRDFYGVFPLRGKLLNVRNATYSTIIKNAEISNLIKILGLNFKCKYENSNEMNSLRYGKVMIMADQDDDGSHIKGLIINFIHSYWPKLVQNGFIQSFITPLIKVFYKNETLEFFSYPEYKEWKDATPNSHKWRVKYYKGLGTSTSIEAKKYFSNMERHCIDFRYDGDVCDQAIKMAFSKDSVDARKKWLDAALLETKRRRQLNLPDIYLYQKSTKCISYNDFINIELVQFSNADNQRAIPNIMDGLKPSQRKVLYTMLKRYEKKEIKVAQLAGAVSELTAYHHGEMSMANTIIGLAQDFVGSNNINLLLPLGQFGSRLNGGKDAASPRYIFTSLNPLTRYIFPEFDDFVLSYQMEDNQLVEPEWYCPIIPMVLVNGAEGIGTAYATKIPNFNPREIISNLKDMILNGADPKPMKPWFKDFTGEIVQIGENKFSILGTLYSLKDNKVEIAELPIRTWTQPYKEEVLQPMLESNISSGTGNDTNSKKASDLKIISFEEYHSDTKVRFVVSLEKNALTNYTSDYVFKQLKLESYMSTTSLVLYDNDGVLKKFDSVEDIMKLFYQVRYKKYQQRKSYLIEKYDAYARKLKNQARFILAIINDEIVLKHKKKKEMIEILRSKNFDTDPVKRWQNKVAKSSDNNILSASLMESETDPSGINTDDETDSDFEYLYGMSLLHLTNEKKDALLKERDDQLKLLEAIKNKSVEEMWLEDLDRLLEQLDKQEQLATKENLPGPKLNDFKIGSSLKSKKSASTKVTLKHNITPNRIDRFTYQPSMVGVKNKIVKYNKDDPDNNNRLLTNSEEDISIDSKKNVSIKNKDKQDTNKTKSKSNTISFKKSKASHIGSENVESDSNKVSNGNRRKRKIHYSDKFSDTISDEDDFDIQFDRPSDMGSEDSAIYKVISSDDSRQSIEHTISKSEKKTLKDNLKTIKQSTTSKKTIARFDDGSNTSNSDSSIDDSTFDIKNMSYYDDEDYM